MLVLCWEVIELVADDDSWVFAQFGCGSFGVIFGWGQVVERLGRSVPGYSVADIRLGKAAWECTDAGLSLHYLIIIHIELEATDGINRVEGMQALLIWYMIKWTSGGAEAGRWTIGGWRQSRLDRPRIDGSWCCRRELVEGKTQCCYDLGTFPSYCPKYGWLDTPRTLWTAGLKLAGSEDIHTCPCSDCIRSQEDKYHRLIYCCWNIKMMSKIRISGWYSWIPGLQGRPNTFHLRGWSRSYCHIFDMPGPSNSGSLQEGKIHIWMKSD